MQPNRKFSFVNYSLIAIFSSFGSQKTIVNFVDLCGLYSDKEDAIRPAVLLSKFSTSTKCNTTPGAWCFQLLISKI